MTIQTASGRIHSRASKHVSLRLPPLIKERRQRCVRPDHAYVAKRFPSSLASEPRSGGEAHCRTVVVPTVSQRLRSLEKERAQRCGRPDHAYIAKGFLSSLANEQRIDGEAHCRTVVVPTVSQRLRSLEKERAQRCGRPDHAYVAKRFPSSLANEPRSGGEAHCRTVVVPTVSQRLRSLEKERAQRCGRPDHAYVAKRFPSSLAKDPRRGGEAFRGTVVVPTD